MAKKGTADSLKMGLTNVLIFLEARIKESVREKFRKTPKLSGAGAGIGAEGTLHSSWAHAVTQEKGANLSGFVGTWAKHARLQEKGGTITPKNAKALTIPFYEKTKGRNYPPAKDLWAQGLTFIMSKSGGKAGLIALKAKGAQGGKPKPIYALRKQVTIPATPYIAPVMLQFRYSIQKLIGDKIVEKFKGGG